MVVRFIVCRSQHGSQDYWKSALFFTETNIVVSFIVYGNQPWLSALMFIETNMVVSFIVYRTQYG
jgi:hypothetical protein